MLVKAEIVSRFHQTFHQQIQPQEKKPPGLLGLGDFQGSPSHTPVNQLELFRGSIYRSHLPLMILIMARLTFPHSAEKLLKCVKKPNAKVFTPLKLNIAPEKGPSQKESQPPTII